VAQN
jgi:hypothetical protein